MLTKNHLNCDLCVIGGGMSGIAAAIAAAREGAKVVLMHERPVLGGNASSEIRMWICGSHGENNRETGILEEIALENLYRNPTKSYAIWDTVLYDFVRREENITLLLNCTCMDATVEKGSFPHNRDTRIKTITGYQMTTQSFYEVEAAFFCDSSGDSILAPLCGANFRMGREDESSAECGESMALSDSMTMGMSCLPYGRETSQPVPFIAPDWSTKITDEDFENRRKPNLYDDAENFWCLELGGDQDTIGDTENIRDRLVALALGTWDYIKNSGKYNADNWDLEFLGFLPGKRESRRMCGEYMLKKDEILSNHVFEDEIAFGGWPIDDHFPGGFYHRGKTNHTFRTPAPYSIPYRTLYSKNVSNLFFAGRNISATHIAMSSTRVMATCAILGEAVGKAASIAAKYHLTPHDVYLQQLELLQELLLNEDCFLPSKTRRISAECRNASLRLLGGSRTQAAFSHDTLDTLRNGQDRAHKIYHTEEADNYCYIPLHSKISYEFEKTFVSSVHLVFDSDLNRNTLPGSICERTHSTRANRMLNSPIMHMPQTLCKSFLLIGELDGQRVELMHVTNNRKRAYHLEINKPLDKLILVPTETWGDKKETVIISFDFN